MQKAVRWSEYFELAALFGIQYMALGIWMVPLSTVLGAHQLQSIRPYAFATSAIAAFVSPLIFGAMADRHASPVKVLRGLSVASALSMLLVAWSIRAALPQGIILLLIQLYALCAAPTTSISTTIIFSRLGNSRNQYGPIRATGTFGWMCGCWLVSALGADTSTFAMVLGASIWLVVTIFTFFLPSVSPPASAEGLTWKQRLGWDALTLFNNPDHRVVFVTAALYSIPLAAFYVFTPPHLKYLGFERLSAWMTLGQITEIFALLALGRLFLRFRLKWIFTAALTFGILRFILCALNNRPGLLAGIILHGLGFTFFFTTAQIYLNERVDVAWRGRAQALMSLMTSGIGNLIGYLTTGWWMNACIKPTGTQWTLFWSGLSIAVTVVTLYFLSTYRGRQANAHLADNT